MKKIYNRPCVDVLLFTTSSTILNDSMKVDASEETDNPELTGGYREWDNIWGE